MVFIATAGAVRVDLQHLHAGQQVHNVIWATRDSSWTQAQREALNTAIAGWWDTNAKNLCHSSMALTQVQTVNQDTANAPASTLVIASPSSGTRTGGAQGSNVACCVTLRTDLRGRNFRGRYYLGGIDLSALASAIQYTTGFLTSVLTTFGALKTAIDALGALWVVVSHFTGNIARGSGLKTPVTAISVDSYLDSQRRRLGLRGV
jgi:hypothetical protein